MFRNCRSLALRLFVGCLALSAAASSSAFAQFGGGGIAGMGDISQPEYSPRDVPTVVRVLHLDETQRSLVEAFLTSYSDSFRAEAERVQEEMNTLREGFENGGARNGDWRERIEPFRQVMERAMKTRTALGDEFLGSVKSVLREDQVDYWPAFERVMRRKNSVPKGMLSGERVDLVILVDELAIDPDKRLSLEPTLEEYEVQLDQALVARDADMDRAQDEIREALQDMDFDKGLEIWDRQKQLRVRIRDINETYALRIIDALENSLLLDAGDFRARYREAAYPTVYSETYGQQKFKAALELEYPDESAKAPVQALAERFTATLQQTNEQLERVVREHEPKSFERQIEMMRARMNGEQVGRRDFEEDPIRTGLNERSDYEQGMLQQLDSLLTQEQREALPKPTRRPDGQRRGGQGLGGGGAGLPPGVGGGGGRGGDWRNGDGGGERGGGGNAGVLDERGFPRGLGGG